MSVRPAKTQISLDIRPAWSESSLCAQWVAKDPMCLHADSKDSDQTGRMPRLIWVFAGRTATLLVLTWGGLNVTYWVYNTVFSLSLAVVLEYRKQVYTIGIKHYFPFINIRKVPREVFNTSRGTVRMLMNDKILFDRYYCINSTTTHRKLRKCSRTLFFGLTTIFLREHAFYKYPQFGPWSGTFSHVD